MDAVAGLVVDCVIASAVQYELDHDEDALRTRLDAIGIAVPAVVAAGPGRT